jgi:AbiV family abortive infection protein
MSQSSVGKRDLLQGAWYSLEQAGTLLDCAVQLYDAGEWSSALGLAMLGREELGRSRILRDCARDATPTNMSPADVRARCNDHLTKQAKAVWSHTFTPARDSALGKAIIALTESPPASAEAAAAERVIRNAVKGQRRQLPYQRHDARMRSFYVDIEDSGEWSRPASITPEEAREMIGQAVNDYATAFHNLNLEAHAPEMTAARVGMTRPAELRPPKWPKRQRDAE